MGTDAQRAKLYALVASQWGEEAADTMMAVMPPWDHDEVARKADVENCRVELKGDIARLEGKIGQLEGKVEVQFGRMVVVNAGMMFGFAGFLAVAKLTGK